MYKNVRNNIFRFFKHWSTRVKLVLAAQSDIAYKRYALLVWHKKCIQSQLKIVEQPFHNPSYWRF